MASEEPQYTILKKSDNIEVRQYDEYIIAETIVAGDFEDVSNEGFRRLLEYIGGANIKKEEIEMTAPVNQEKVTSKGEKIEMTAPVSQEPLEEGRYKISFVMPSRFSLETLPSPTDDRIVHKVIPAKKMVVIRYSGTWSKSKYVEHLEKLMEYLEQQKFQVKSEAIWARYNAPFVPWFLRRNEIMIEVEM